MTGADVGIVEKKQGRFTFPERDPETGWIIDSALDAERHKKSKELNAVLNCMSRTTLLHSLFTLSQAHSRRH